MSTVAVVLALGGVSYAAGLAPNSVTSATIKNNAVKSADIKNGSLKAKDFKPGTLLTGPAGAAGAPGAAGPAGPTYGKTRILGLPSLGGGENFVGETVITLPVAGPVYIDANSQISLSCTSASSVVLGVVVDGTAVPGTTRSTTSGVMTPYNVSGVTASLSPGDHTIFLAGTCVGAATSNGMSSVESSISAILLGSS